MAEGAGQLSPTGRHRERGVRAALFILAVTAGSAVLATLVAGVTSGLSAGLDGLARPALFTLWQAQLSTFLSLAFAVPVALALESLPDERLRTVLLSLFAIPLSLPAIVAVLAVLTVAGRAGWMADVAALAGYSWKPDVYGLAGILLAHVFFNMPLAVRMLAAAFDGIAEEQWKLAASLKLPFAARVSIVLWPAMRPALPGIASLIFMLCAASYTVILMIGGGPLSATLQTSIQQALTFDFDIGRAAMLTLLQLALTLFLALVLPLSMQIVRQPGHSGKRRWHRVDAFEATGAGAVTFAALIFVGLPLIAIVVAGLSGDHVRVLSEPALHRAATMSVVIAFVSAGFALVLAWLLAAGTANRDGHSAWPNRVPIILLGVPPLVLGTGWFVIAHRLGAVTIFAPIAVVAANALMALPFAMQLIAPALASHFAATDRLAATLHLSGWRRLTIADFPTLKRPLMQAFLFAFALSLGDLGVVTLFGNDQISTLPAYIQAKMGAYRTNDAAVLALYLALLTGFLTYLATKGPAHDQD